MLLLKSLILCNKSFDQILELFRLNLSFCHFVAQNKAVLLVANIIRKLVL